MHNDKEILVKFTYGNLEAADELIEKYKIDLYNFCFKLTFNKYDADDLFQETWVKAVTYSNQFKGENFKPWIFKICINQFKDNYRKMKKKKTVMFDSFLSSESKEFFLTNKATSLSAEDEVNKKNKQTHLYHCIYNLPIKQKLPIILFYIENMKYKEISTYLLIPEGTVKSRISNGKKKLQKLLGEV